MEAEGEPGRFPMPSSEVDGGGDDDDDKYVTLANEHELHL
jgi:hypothetical protein